MTPFSWGVPAEGEFDVGEPGPLVGQPPATEPPGHARTRARAFLPFAGGVVAALIAVALVGALFPPARPLSTADVNEAIASALASVTPPPPFSEGAWARAQPAVVLIEAGAPLASASPSGSLGASPAPSGGADSPGSLGTGVVINDQGYIMTAFHVVQGASSITVTFADGSRSAAVVASSHPETDIAVLRAATLPQGLAPAVLGNPGSLRVGSEVYALGSPFGLYGSLSAGVVSALNRSFTQPDGRLITGLIQIDAAVNPGNSGGPLLNRAGQVVGIVDALINPTKEDVFIGIGLAVPIDVAGGAAGLPQY